MYQGCSQQLSYVWVIKLAIRELTGHIICVMFAAETSMCLMAKPNVGWPPRSVQRMFKLTWTHEQPAGLRTC